jgi:hypothetical protein
MGTAFWDREAACCPSPSKSREWVPTTWWLRGPGRLPAGAVSDDPIERTRVALASEIKPLETIAQALHRLASLEGTRL